MLAPFTFSWSALVVCLALYLVTGFGVTMGYHGLLTHRSFQTPKLVEYILTVLGTLANRTISKKGHLDDGQISRSR